MNATVETGNSSNCELCLCVNFRQLIKTSAAGF